MTVRRFLGLVSALLLAACNGRGVTPPATTDVMGGQLLSAFFGLDNALPRNLACPGSGGQDGMPVVLSLTANAETMQKEDFRIVTEAGVEYTPFCATFAPATGTGELRTVLVTGELGDAGQEPPVLVRVVGDLLSDGMAGEVVNFRGAEVAVIPLSDGPTLIWAEPVLLAEAIEPSGRNAGTACPAGTVQAIRATWTGGVTLPTGEEPGDAERQLYSVMMEGATVFPFALGDLGDNDNNHLLCLDVEGLPLAVFFPAGHLVDPNGDLNPDTDVLVTR